MNAYHTCLQQSINTIAHLSEVSFLRNGSNGPVLSVAVQDIVFQLQKFVTAMAKYHNDCHSVMKDAVVFPIEVDLSRGTFTYDMDNTFNDGEDDDGEEAVEEEGDDTGATRGDADTLSFGETGNLICTD